MPVGALRNVWMIVPGMAPCSSRTMLKLAFALGGVVMAGCAKV